jgi:hypothetical protein
MSGNDHHSRSGQGSFPRRMTDRVESTAAWLLALLGVLGGIIVLVIGTQAHANLLERARTEAATRTPTSAILTRDTPPLAGTMSRGGTQSVRVAVRWVADDGVERVGETVVVAPKQAGDVVTVWSDRNHDLVPAPVEPGQALVGAFVTAGMSALGVSVVLWTMWWAVRKCVLGANRARWAREWARVEPVWSGRTLGGQPS